MQDLSPRAYDDNPNSPFYTPPAEREQAALWDAARGKRAPEAASASQAVPTTPPQVAGLFVFEVYVLKLSSSSPWPLSRSLHGSGIFVL